MMPALGKTFHLQTPYMFLDSTDAWLHGLQNIKKI